MPCSGASRAVELEILVRRDQIDDRRSRTVDRRLVGDEPDALSPQCRGHVGEKDLDAGPDRGLDLGDARPAAMTASAQLMRRILFTVCQNHIPMEDSMTSRRSFLQLLGAGLVAPVCDAGARRARLRDMPARRRAPKRSSCSPDSAVCWGCSSTACAPRWRRTSPARSSWCGTGACRRSRPPATTAGRRPRSPRN